MMAHGITTVDDIYKLAAIAASSMHRSQMATGSSPQAAEFAAVSLAAWLMARAGVPIRDAAEKLCLPAGLTACIIEALDGWRERRADVRVLLDRLEAHMPALSLKTAQVLQ